MINPLLAIAGTILVGSLFYNGVLKFKVDGLRDEVGVLEMKLNEERMNNNVLKGSIKTQNDAIAATSIALDKKQKELDEWKNKPEKIRYNTIYKNLPLTIDIRKEDCETTKDAITAIRSIDFNAI